ncbi:hypothetical protein BOTBODRAFT_56241 [Botryobasidium botryosum FD-172 SS1]|uniref:Fungal-type protein kinase domain-containing protein n=1 Tax=Botryobasidium botryosum (strain FD-172 SS1) TaxID=930990 RepID=A0A067MNL1_BOTB1|nr:hypothetical protein BOTBODRAFT_56241 [Botryobasidium botryosum FD-172 SS1]
MRPLLPFSVDPSRAPAMEELRRIPTIPISDFISHLLPPVDPDALPEAQVHLEQHPSWINFVKMPPRKHEAYKDDAFRQLPEVSDALAQYSVKRQYQEEDGTYHAITTKMEPIPSDDVLRSPENIRICPNAAISVFVSRTGKDEKAPHWFNVNKWSSANWEQNATKVIWHMSYLMANDPTRRFAFGVTVEDVDMHSWCCDRMGFVLSERFGYTSTNSMKRMSTTEGSKEGNFEIQVNERTFCTTRLLNHAGATYEKGDPARVLHALKDCWAEASRRREGDLDALIMERVDELSPEAQRAKIHFLTVICHAEVSHFVSYLDDTASIRNNYAFPSNCPTVKLIKLMTGERSASFRRHRTHYRIAFEEVGDPATSLMDMKNLLDTLVGGAKGTDFPCLAIRLFPVLIRLSALTLDLLDKCGFIYRDVGIHNMVLVGHIGRRCDLEFARESDGSGGTDHASDRVRTSKFLAHELLFGSYLYIDGEWWVFIWTLAFHGPSDMALPTIRTLLLATKSFPPACGALLRTANAMRRSFHRWWYSKEKEWADKPDFDVFRGVDEEAMIPLLEEARGCRENIGKLRSVC